MNVSLFLKTKAMNKQDDLSEFLMSKYLLYLLIAIALLLELCACTKEQDLDLVGVWSPITPKNCIYTGYYNDTVTTMRTFSMENNLLLVKVSDSEHSNGFDIVKNIECRIEYDTIYFNSSIFTTNTCNSNVMMVTQHKAFLKHDTLYENAEYFVYMEGYLIGKGQIKSQYKK